MQSSNLEFEETLVSYKKIKARNGNYYLDACIYDSGRASITLKKGSSLHKDPLYAMPLAGFTETDFRDFKELINRIEV